MSSEQSGAAHAAGARRDVTVRRAPKFLPFMVLGALLGVIAAGVVTFLSPEDPNYTQSAILGFFSVILVIPGLCLGAVVALLLDAISVRRTRRSTAVVIAESQDSTED